MKYFVKEMASSIENVFDFFKDKNNIIENVIDFKKYGITDIKRNMFYIRLSNLKSLNDIKITKPKNGLKTFDSQWVAVFQIDDSNDIEHISDTLFSMIVNYSECISNITFSSDTNKIYTSELSTKQDKNATGSIRYPFCLLYFSFDLSIESTGNLCVPDCETTVSI